MSENYSKCKYCRKILMEYEIHSCQNMYLEKIKRLTEENLRYKSALNKIADDQWNPDIAVAKEALQGESEIQRLTEEVEEQQSQIKGLQTDYANACQQNVEQLRKIDCLTESNERFKVMYKGFENQAKAHQANLLAHPEKDCLHSSEVLNASSGNREASRT